MNPVMEPVRLPVDDLRPGDSMCSMQGKMAVPHAVLSVKRRTVTYVDVEIDLDGQPHTIQVTSGSDVVGVVVPRR